MSIISFICMVVNYVQNNLLKIDYTIKYFNIFGLGYSKQCWRKRFIMSTECQYLNSSIMKCFDHLFELFGSTHRSTTRTCITTHGRKKVDRRVSPCIYLRMKRWGVTTLVNVKGTMCQKGYQTFTMWSLGLGNLLNSSSSNSKTGSSSTALTPSSSKWGIYETSTISCISH